MNGMDAEKTAVGIADESGTTQAFLEPMAEATQLAANVDCPVCHTPNPPSETYCIDCGFLLSQEPEVLVEVPEAVPMGVLVTPDGTREFPLKPGVNSVGRENADVLLSHNTVSRKHAAITVEDGGARIEDIGSTNGTFVDGRKIEPGETVPLDDGCEVVIGSVTLRYASGEPQPPADVAAGESEAVIEALEESQVPSPLAEEGQGEGETPPAARLVSKDRLCSFGLKEGVNTIGRRENANDIVIPDPYCSSRHADLLVEEGVFTITDVGSTNGTLVNGARLEPNAPHTLQEGDEITVGQMAFVIEVE